MSWARVDDRANEHRKMLAVGAEACWMWTCGLMYANRQRKRDGFIPEESPAMFFAWKSSWRKLAAKLVEVGLWERVDGGYQIHDYSEWNPTHEQLEAERAKARERMARVRGEHDPNKTRTNGEHEPNAQGEHQANILRSSGSTPTPLLNVPTEHIRAAPRVAAKRARGPSKVPLPDDWIANESHGLKAANLGLNRDAEAAAFRESARANGRIYADWDAAFHTWLTNAPKFSGRNGNTRPPGLIAHESRPLNDSDLRAIERAKARAAAERRRERAAGND